MNYRVTYHWEEHLIPCSYEFDGDWYGILRKGRKILAKGNRIYLRYNYMRKHKIKAEEIYN